MTGLTICAIRSTGQHSKVGEINERLEAYGVDLSQQSLRLVRPFHVREDGDLADLTRRSGARVPIAARRHLLLARRRVARRSTSRETS